MNTYIYVYTYMYVYISIYIYIYVCTCIYIYIRVCICAYLYVCINVYICIYIYTIYSRFCISWVTFRKLVANYRALLQNVTYQDMIRHAMKRRMNAILQHTAHT